MATTARAPLGASLRAAQRRLVLATGVSSLGDGAYVTAAPLVAAAVTRQPAMVALVAAAEYLPWVFVAPYASVYVDRWPKRPVMVVADLARAVAVGIIALLAWQQALTIPVLALASIVIVAGTVFHDAAGQSVVASVAGREPDRLNQINGQTSAASTAGRQLVGPSTGSVLFAWAPWSPFVLDAASFAGSAAVLASLPTEDAGRADKTAGGVHAAIREGARFLLGSPRLRTLCALLAVANFTYNLAWATFVLLATSSSGLGLGPAGFGLVVTAMAAGGLVGGLGAARIIKAIGGTRVVVLGLLVEAAVWALVALTRSPVVASAGLAAAGLCTSLVTVVAMTARQEAAPPELLARVVSAFRVVSTGVAPLGAAVGGLIATVFGLRAPLWVAAAVLAVASGLLLTSRTKSL